MTDIIESQSNRPIIERRIKPDKKWPEGKGKIYKPSDQKDLEKANEMIAIYKRESVNTDLLDFFKKIGTEIGDRFQFNDKGAGVNTLGGQIDNNTIENRDCKLPSFLLALALDDPENGVRSSIVYLNRLTAHPFVMVESGNYKFYGHYIKPNPYEPKSKSGFALIANGGQVYKELSAPDKTQKFGSDLNGMLGMDYLFLKSL